MFYYPHIKNKKCYFFSYETNSTELTIKLDKKKNPKNKTENGFQMLNKKQGQTTVSRRGAYMATMALRLRPSGRPDWGSAASPAKVRT